MLSTFSAPGPKGCLTDEIGARGYPGRIAKDLAELQHRGQRRADGFEQAGENFFLREQPAGTGKGTGVPILMIE